MRAATAVIRDVAARARNSPARVTGVSPGTWIDIPRSPDEYDPCFLAVEGNFQPLIRGQGLASTATICV